MLIKPEQESNKAKPIVIYRHQLFQPSEGFITDQTQYLYDFYPIFTGRSARNIVPHHHFKVKTLESASYFDQLRYRFLRHPKLFYEALSADSPVLIHAHFGVEGSYALPLAKKFDIPLITTFHGFDATSSTLNLCFSKKLSWINYLLHRRELKQHGTLFIAVSHFIQERLIKLGFPEKKIIKHYIGIDVEKIKPLASKKQAQQTILHVARLVEKKGTKYLLLALAHLLDRGKDIKLIIIGDGPLKHSLQMLTKKLKLTEHVQFLGVKSPADVITEMQQATVFCLPSIQATSGDSEGLGMVLLEASACALPIVATSHGGIKEAIVDNKTGFLVPEKNSILLADRLQYVLEHTTIAEEMGKQGRQFVEKNFNLHHQTQKLEQIYHSLL